eukprot:13575079-Alexandrium_andersonii.AAC.1
MPVNAARHAVQSFVNRQPREDQDAPSGPRARPSSRHERQVCSVCRSERSPWRPVQPCAIE